jgi:SPP1 family predicted phage head-tail adaptor
MIGYNKNEIIGKMRERVILQNRVISQSDSGFQSETYSNIATLWTALDYKSGFEEEDADKIVSQQKINFTLRYNENITTDSRFVYRDSLYQIEKIDISNDRRFVFCTGVYRSSYTGSYALTIDVAASVNGSATISANVNSLLYLACQANASASTTATITKIIEVSSLVNANASLSGDINFVQKAQASLLATGTTTADLTVGSSVDADAAAFFARVTAAGGTLTATEQTAVNTLVIAMKADGIWTKMKAIYPMVGSSAAACAQNLKSLSYTGLFTSGWTFANAGVTGNGTSAYMNTNFIPSTDYLNSSNFGLFLYTSSTTAGSTDRDLAIFTGAGLPSLNLTAKDSISAKADLFTYNNRISISGYNVQGFYIGSRTASNSAKLYRNGIEIGSTIGSAGTAPSIYLTLGGANTSTSNPILSTNFYSAKTFSLVGICDGLNDTEAANFYTAVQAFQTTLNRQVV